MNLSPNVGEDDLHAVVDGQLAADRHQEVMAYLAVYPDAADRVSAFFRQRVELAALRERLSDGEPTDEVAGLERALCDAIRQGQRRRRRALSGGGLLLVLLAAVSGWWLTLDRDRVVVAEAGPSSRGGQMLPGREPLDEIDPITTEAGDSAVLWLQAHLGGQPLKQPDLESLGLRFVGGSTLKSARGPAIRLVYTDEAGAAFALFVGVKESGVGLAASLAPEGHVSLSWQHEPLTFTLIAPQGSSRLDEIMRSAGELLDPVPVSADAALGGHTAGDGADEVETTKTPSAGPLDADGAAPAEVSKSL